MKTKIILALILALALVLVSGCTNNNGNKSTVNLPPRENGSIAPTDYSVADNWAIVTKNPDKPVDVFLLYPITYMDPAPLSDIDNTRMRERADRDEKFFHDLVENPKTIAIILTPISIIWTGLFLAKTIKNKNR